MEHQRIQRTSSWSRPAPKRDAGSIEPSETVQQKTASASGSQQSLVDRSPEPSDAMQQDPVMRKILANNPTVRQIFQQYSQPGVATQDKDSNDTVQKQTAPAAPAEKTIVDKSPEPSDWVQQDPVMMRIMANNPTVRQIFQQQKQPGEKSSESKIQQVAAKGFSGSSTSLPHQNQIQQSFGVDLSDVQAYIGGEAAAACQQMGAQAYASGNQIAFKEQPSVELAAHEAAHVVQQASGKVQLAGGVGKVGDKYENHADAVAAKVAAGESAKPLLADFSEQKTDSGERQFQGKSPTDQNSTSSHLSQVRTNPLDEVQRLSDLGFAEGKKGNYQAALKYLEEALKLAPNDSVNWYNRGLVLLKLNRLQEALDSNQTALAINTNWGEAQPSFAWNNRGVILSRLGRFNEALQSYQQAVALNPGYELAQNNITKLSARLQANPSLRNQNQQTPEPQQGNNILQILLGVLQGEFNENQTGEQAIANFLIGLIPIIGQAADARDLAAYLYRIVFKKQVGDPWNWIGLALTLVGLVPVVGDIAKYLGKTALGGNLQKLLKNAEGLLSHIRSLSPEQFDNVAQLKNLLAQNWGKGVKAAKDRWNEILGQLLNWANGIPDLFFSNQKQQLIKDIQKVSDQSNTMLTEAFNKIWEEINKALDEIGRALNPNGELVTPEGVRVPSDEVDEAVQGPLRIEGGNSGGRVSRYIRLDELIQRRNAVIAECGKGLVIRAEGNLLALLRNADIFIRIREEGLEGMLRDGRYKTLFETGAEEAIRDPTSYAAQGITRRGNGEERLFGYPQTLPPQNRPVYGYVARQADSPEAGIVGLGYGENIVIKVKPETRTRATFTADDSLFSSGDRMTRQPSMFDSPNIASFVSLEDIANVNDLQQKVQRIASAQNLEELMAIKQQHFYFEAQIHGQFKVSDIAEIIYLGAQPSETIARLARERGITIVVR